MSESVKHIMRISVTQNVLFVLSLPTYSSPEKIKDFLSDVQILVKRPHEYHYIYRTFCSTLVLSPKWIPNTRNGERIK